MRDKLDVMLDVARAKDADGRATRWDAHKAQRRAEVLDAAIAAIERDGAGVGVKQIADQVGLPRSVVYRHFKDRHDLDAQIRQAIVDRLMAKLAPALTSDGLAAEGTVELVVRNVMDTYVSWVERHPQLHRFLGLGVSKEGIGGPRVVTGAKTAIAVHVRGLFEKALLAQGADPTFADPLAFGGVGLVDSVVNRWLSEPSPTLTSAQLAEFLTGSICGYLEENLRTLGADVDRTARISDLIDT